MINVTSDTERLPLGRRHLLMSASQAIAVLGATAILLAPALWNRYPLLQYDSGGYLARWYEGYLVPSRSTVFGLFLHAGEQFSFWPELSIQAGLTIWVISIVLRAFRIGDNLWRVTAVVGVISVFTALPVLASMLLTDIFAGLAVLSFYLVVFHPDNLKRWELLGLFLLISFCTATHSATMMVLIALLAISVVMSFVKDIRAADLIRGGTAIALGAAMLLGANFVLSRQLAWTPGGYGIVFGRMLQDGIVARYLAAHCPDPRFKLCPHRADLPKTADEFLWSYGVFNELGRFAGLEKEMGIIVRESLIDYPLQQIETATAATIRQLTLVASGAGVHENLPHTYGIIERYIPSQARAVRAARQQRGELNFDAVNRLHVPVAWLSTILAAAMALLALLRRKRIDDVSMLATFVTTAILANAFVCGVVSGPHDRYGARIVWIATFAIAVAMLRWREQQTPLA